jgi:opacity protein-like surface antigen
MKKLFLTIVLAFIGIFTAQAQWYIGGGLKANFVKEAKSFTLSPDAGYCFKNVPLSLGCSVEYEGAIQSGEAYSHALTLSPYFRYTICDIGERFSFFTDLSADIDALKFGLLNVGLSPGVSFDVTDHWSAEFSIGFLSYNREQAEDKSIKHSFELELKLAAPSFGIYYNF